MEIIADNIENSKRKTVLIKVLPAYKIFEELIIYYGVIAVLEMIKAKQIGSFDTLIAALPAKTNRSQWSNIGGQLIESEELVMLKEKIHHGKIKSWDHVHAFYQEQGQKYPVQKWKHAIASLSDITGIQLKKMTVHQFSNLLNAAIATKEWMTKCIYDSRAKDYANPYRKMVYENAAEMNEVMGKLEDNNFIKQQVAELQLFKKEITALKKKLKV